MRRLIITTCVLLLFIFCKPVLANPNVPVGKMLDVVIIELDCLENETKECEGYRPLHLVEYMGADWCEPCRLTESQLEKRPDDGSFVLKHHPSLLDVTYLYQSEFRFTNVLGLWGLPSVVIDGRGLLSGVSQINELDIALSNRTDTNFSGFNSVKLDNNTLYWTSNKDGVFVEAWTVGTVTHSIEGYSLTNMAINQSESANSSIQVDTNGEYLVVMLHIDGPVELEADSSAIITQVEAINDRFLIDYFEQPPSHLAMYMFLLLVTMLLPAIIIHLKELRNNSKSEDE